MIIFQSFFLTLYNNIAQFSFYLEYQMFFEKHTFMELIFLFSTFCSSILKPNLQIGKIK